MKYVWENRRNKKNKFVCVRNTPELKCFESFHDDYGKLTLV